MTVSPLGRDIDRVDGRAKATGTARYSADYPAANLAHAYLVTSTIARGTISAMDTTAAQNAPGVIRVYSPFNKLGLRPVPGAGENYAPLEDTQIRFRGQIIAMVVAERLEQARDAARLVHTTYDEQTPRLSLADEPRVPATGPPGVPAPSATVLAPGVPSIEAALAASDVVVEASFHQPMQHPAAMELHSVLAEWNSDQTQLILYSGAQLPHTSAMVAAGRLGVAPTAVRLIAPYVGGGFGSRVFPWYDAALAAAAARQLNRPVKLVLSREQVFTVVGHRSAVNQTIKLGASRDGVLNAVSHVSDAAVPFVGYRWMQPAVDVSAVLYKTPNVAFDQRHVMLDVPPACAMRAPNEAPGAFALETAMDELAVATGLDPVELRLRNYATTVPGTDRRWSSKHLDDCYRIGAQRFGWSARRARPGSRVDGQWLVGMGMASAIYPGGRRPEPIQARVQLRDDGTALVSSATADTGTGATTLLAITGAHGLGIPLRRVRSEAGDTALPQGAPSVGSTAAASTVPAVEAAVEGAVAALIQEAVSNPLSPWHGANSEELTYEKGQLRGRGQSMPFGRLLTTIDRRNVEATATAQPGPEAGEYKFHSFGAHFCEVRVNRYTGEPRITRFTTVVDAGRIVNAQAARSQLVGGVIFGIGHALLEDDPLELDTGRVAAGNMADYMVPVNADIPAIDVHFLDRPDPVINSLGARGLGELGTVGSAAAVGNAIFNATGKRIRSLPITLDKLL
ncbi:xanthine dehydrogenase family protein molybdopterin-binding subunit [Micromonospora endophytica]|uniref:Carbon monoxide dehydrogenase n=1 Tax=Micromonospora endophytica TaxID=515350 RepID=A0A2W2CL41_9ACTN|nr:xanthine dehydrogenase family protein molybdopterin-binding subunit [Micromonospora endophytica]PZF98660.1 carbon monoxide dehydrogenase [Micromonospora endophytica]RIW45195.1 xanthine dehydrogenase family protein molybdopterin-binding subunit [Micromonospora endophytica]BCJ59601.1 carbon-monoxide dehydrogenase large subunit [Micromonospora endophytica]